MERRENATNFILDLVFACIYSYHFFNGVEDMRDVATVVSDPERRLFAREYTLTAVNPLRTFVENAANKEMIDQMAQVLGGSADDVTFSYILFSQSRISRVPGATVRRAGLGYEYIFSFEGVSNITDLTLIERRPNVVAWYFLAIGSTIAFMVGYFYYQKNKNSKKEKQLKPEEIVEIS